MILHPNGFLYYTNFYKSYMFKKTSSLMLFTKLYINLIIIGKYCIFWRCKKTKLLNI